MTKSSAKKTGRRKTTEARQRLDPQIEALRHAVGMSQEEFARRLGTTRVAVVHWENGRSFPTADTYVKLARLAKSVPGGEPLAFLDKAGISLKDLKDFVPDISNLLRRAEQRTSGRVVDIPVAVDPRQDSDGRRGLPISGEFVRNPAFCKWVRVSGEHDLSIFRRPQYALLDSSECDVRELEGCLVLVAGEPGPRRDIDSRRFRRLWGKSGALVNPEEAARLRVAENVYLGFLSLPSASLFTTPGVPDWYLETESSSLTFDSHNGAKVLGRVVAMFAAELEME